MKIPIKTLKSGFSLPVYGLGTVRMGGLRGEMDTSRDSQEIEAIQAAIDYGVTHIDTAEVYGDGHTEEIVGRAIANFDRRKLFITTKVAKWNQGYDGVRRAIDGSLGRLETDYVDLYLLHQYPPKGLPIDETMKAMTELVDEGIVRYIGVSNITIPRYEEAQKHTPHKLVCNQLHYNLQFREVEKYGLVKYCQENDIMLVAWSPLQQGRLPESQLISELAVKYQKTSIQIALNWLISQKNVVTIPKTSHIEHLKENLGSLDWQLEADDVERLSKKFPNQQATSDIVPLDYRADIAP